MSDTANHETSQAEQLLAIASEVADRRADFFETKGPGPGDRATNESISALRVRALQEFGVDYAEKAICGSNGFRVDYYFPEEATIVEIALGLPRPKTEFERDILKAIMAQEAGRDVRLLFFISKPGAIKKCSQPGRTAITEWLERNHGIKIEVRELEACST